MSDAVCTGDTAGDGDWVVLYVVTRDGGIVGQLERHVFATEEEAIADYWTNRAGHAVKTAMWWTDSQYAPKEPATPLLDRNGKPVVPGEEGHLSVAQKVRRWKPDDGRHWGGMVCYGQVRLMDVGGERRELLDVAAERTQFDMEDALKFAFMTDQVGYLNERYAAAESAVRQARNDSSVDDAATARLVREEAEIEHSCQRLDRQIQELAATMFGAPKATSKAGAQAGAPKAGVKSGARSNALKSGATVPGDAASGDETSAGSRRGSSATGRKPAGAFARSSKPRRRGCAVAK
ncbi:hypothetical protein [Bifidobacterium choloepi]|uniref:Uncharacterized protein n=1 Tax=Bifidobacterium choloepi TaxID=2614131 RepID=A0A6I5ND33_9BIFI|nr:hypothetical protein [Bifidobacterium choloepi]NEG70450.1 hypothetical protein [Bifidobacterium choloepi]